MTHNIVTIAKTYYRETPTSSSPGKRLEEALAIHRIWSSYEKMKIKIHHEDLSLVKTLLSALQINLQIVIVK